MKFLHTSDWHLGKTLYGRNRYTEFSAFLEWLAELIEKEEVDVLLLPVMSSTPQFRAPVHRNFTTGFSTRLPVPRSAAMS